MKRVLTAAAVLGLGTSMVMAQQEIAVQQDNLMRGLARNLYGTMLKTAKGDTKYDQAAIDNALVELEQGVAKIAKTFEINPKEDVKDATYGASQKIWQNKADFDTRIPPVAKAIADLKGKIKDAATLKVAYETLNTECNKCHETYRVKLK
jgi:cytochrome c556